MADTYFLAEQENLRKLSGSVDSSDPLVDFLYHLMRDHLPPGAVSTLAHDATTRRKMREVNAYTNGWLANYARYLAAEIGQGPTT